ncbi:MAG: DinB family protein [Ignavibacteria bacterium]|nr:DinB family protein [Ignavibacteria bacterium]
MINIIKDGLWKQFGASIDTLKNAIEMWPEEYWNTDRKFFYIVFHTMIFLDYYLTIPPDNFSSGLPFKIAARGEELKEAVDDVTPERVYSKKEMLDYLEACREKCHKLIGGLSEEKIKQVWIEKPDELSPPDILHYTTLEILLYNMRHVQHHSAQLNMILRKKINNSPDWVSHAEDGL